MQRVAVLAVALAGLHRDPGRQILMGRAHDVDALPDAHGHTCAGQVVGCDLHVIDVRDGLSVVSVLVLIWRRLWLDKLNHVQLGRLGQLLLGQRNRDRANISKARRVDAWDLLLGDRRQCGQGLVRRDALVEQDRVAQPLGAFALLPFERLIKRDRRRKLGLWRKDGGAPHRVSLRGELGACFIDRSDPGVAVDPLEHAYPIGFQRRAEFGIKRTFEGHQHMGASGAAALDASLGPLTDRLGQLQTRHGPVPE